MTQSMTNLFANNAVSGTVININDIEAADTRAMILDYAKRALLCCFPEEQIKANTEGRGTFSIVRGSILFTVVDTFQVGASINGNDKAVCIKGKHDSEWHGIDSDVMDEAIRYRLAEKSAIKNGKKSAQDFQVGDFILGTNEGSKEGSIIDYLRWFADSQSDGSFNTPALCHIERIEDLTEDELDAYNFMDQKPEDFDGGSYSEDVPDTFNGYDFNALTYAQRHSWVQRVCILRTPSRWVAVDPQGYSYCRYVHFPLQWRKMFAQDIEKAEEKERQYQAYLQAEEDKRNAAQQARYDERTERILEATDGLKGIKPIEWDKKGAQTRCNNAIKRVLKAFYPGTDFAVTKDYEWHSVEVSWTGGPDDKDVRDILEAMRGDAWSTNDYDYSGYGGYVTEYRDNKITDKLGQVGRIRTYHRAA